MPPESAQTDIVILDDSAEIYLSHLQPLFPEVSFAGATHAEDASRLITNAFGFFALSPAITDQVVSSASRLRWIQALTSGVDTFDTLKSLPPNAILTSARGIHGPQVSEMALLHMLALVRDLPRMLLNQQARRWERWPQPILWRRTVTIIGIGVIAEDLAVRCQAMGMTVLGVTSTPRASPNFSRMFHRNEIAAAVSEADFVVVLAPHTPQTHHMIDAAVLAAMKPTAYLVNVARGGVVDQRALLLALQEERIAGAGLDVFETEPLPVDDPLWTAPRTLITPHLGGMSEIYELQVLPILVHNLAAYLRGDFQAMRNRVDRNPSSQSDEPFTDEHG